MKSGVSRNHGVFVAEKAKSVEPVGRIYFWTYFFGDFLATTSHMDNVTDDHRYSRLLADFLSTTAGAQHGNRHRECGHPCTA